MLVTPACSFGDSLLTNYTWTQHSGKKTHHFHYQSHPHGQLLEETLEVYHIRESVDSLCRDGADEQYMQ